MSINDDTGTEIRMGQCFSMPIRAEETIKMNDQVTQQTIVDCVDDVGYEFKRGPKRIASECLDKAKKRFGSLRASANQSKPLETLKCLNH